MNCDLTDIMNNGNIKALRGFDGGKWFVCSGESFYGRGLCDNYRKFSTWVEAYDYFSTL